MFTWGIIIWLGLWLIFYDLKPETRANMLGHPFWVHTIVIGSGLLIHGGSADGAMAAITAGVFSAIYVRLAKRWSGYIKNGVWHPGLRVRSDPRRRAT